MRLLELPDGGDVIARVVHANGDLSWVTRHAGSWHQLPLTLSQLCAVRVEAAHQCVEDAGATHALNPSEYTLLPPLDDHQEVWAAGVTYERSKTARIEESGAHDLYSAVYVSPRPELFFKATGRRAVGCGERIGVRADATWSVPEPELAVVFAADGQVLGFTIGDDVSSRDIEGANALYLPQAKVYDRSCAIGPAIVPAWALQQEPVFTIELEIHRGSEVVYEGTTSTSQLHRHWDDLGQWLRACLTFDDGVILLTGTGIVPNDDVTLTDGDEVVVAITELGELRNTVKICGIPVIA